MGLLATLALALAAGAAQPVATSDLPPLTGRVVDMADLLTPAEEARLGERLAALERRTSDQLIVVTTPSLGARTIEEYGLWLGNGWHIGQRGRDNGLLIIVAPSERKTRIEVGYGLEAILTNERARRIVDRDLVPNFQQGLWQDGIEAGTQAIISLLVAHEREPRRRRR